MISIESNEFEYVLISTNVGIGEIERIKHLRKFECARGDVPIQAHNKKRNELKIV